MPPLPTLTLNRWLPVQQALRLSPTGELVGMLLGASPPTPQPPLTGKAPRPPSESLYTVAGYFCGCCAPCLQLCLLLARLTKWVLGAHSPMLKVHFVLVHVRCACVAGPPLAPAAPASVPGEQRPASTLATPTSSPATRPASASPLSRNQLRSMAAVVLDRSADSIFLEESERRLQVRGFQLPRPALPGPQ